MKILLVDQFSQTPTPYELSLRPMRFDELVAQELHREPPLWAGGVKTQLLDVPDDWRPPMSSIAFRAGPDGMAEVWKMRLDSSG